MYKAIGTDQKPDRTGSGHTGKIGRPAGLDSRMGRTETGWDRARGQVCGWADRRAGGDILNGHEAVRENNTATTCLELSISCLDIIWVVGNHLASIWPVGSGPSGHLASIWLSEFLELDGMDLGLVLVTY